LLFLFRMLFNAKCRGRAKSSVVAIAPEIGLLDSGKLTVAVELSISLRKRSLGSCRESPRPYSL
jgi:hypothetical protein